MAFDLVPQSFWSFPSLRPWLDDEDWLTSLPSTPSGLSISEDDKHVFVEAHLPGLKSEDIDVTYHKGELWIKGDKKDEEKDKNRKFYRTASSSYSYRVMVPGDVDESKEPDASYKDGVMTVTFDKLAKTQPKKIAVKKG
jgi:HSP20 family protein